MILAALAATDPASAGLILGTYDTGNCYPFLCNDSGRSSGQSIDYQQVYAASAFSGPIAIKSVSFFFDPVDSPLPPHSTVLGGTYRFYFSYAAHGVGFLDTTLANNVSGPLTLFANVGGGANTDPVWTILGAPFHYNPSVADLLLEVVASDQDNVPNGFTNGYNQADDTGLKMSAAYCVTDPPFPGTPIGCGSSPAALVTGFNVPEPGTLALFCVGLLGFGMLRWRKAL